MDWKEKLDQPEQLPEFTWKNKQAAWEQLYTRLEKKPTSKRFFFWLAAASILIILSLLFLDPSVEKRQIRNVPDQPVTKNSLPAIKENKAAEQPAINLQTNQQENIVRTGDSKKKMKIQTATLPEKEIIPAAAIATENKPEENLVSTSSVPDSIAVNTVAKEKKRFRVIHINELGVPDDEEIGLINAPDKHPSKFIFGNQEVFDSQTPGTEHHKKGFLRFRIASQN